MTGAGAAIGSEGQAHACELACGWQRGYFTLSSRQATHHRGELSETPAFVTWVVGRGMQRRLSVSQKRLRGVHRDTCDLPRAALLRFSLFCLFWVSYYSSHGLPSLLLRPLRGRSARRRRGGTVLQLQELCLTRRGAERLHWPLEAAAGSYNGPSRGVTSEAVTAGAWLRLERV